MSAPSGYRIELAKEDFKFSAAHFTLFGPEAAERLHGHNYRVSIAVSGPSLDERGLLVDFDRLKRAVRDCCAALDDRILVPTGSDWLAIAIAGGEVEVRYAGRRYVFPESEVVLLPCVNTSVELLARHLWGILSRDLAGLPLDSLAVAVEETAGQRGRYEASLSPD
ncbi:MAG: 6-carboxytetrahydropterin synthase [Holophagales bacterium]|nr:MAG: 6-carboxytetrahydropterin synthase [Holophagales bacterium]